MEKESFVFHQDFMRSIPEEDRLIWFERILKYAFEKEVPNIKNHYEKKAWLNIQERIDADSAAYEKKLEYQREYKERKKREKNGNISEVSETSRESRNILQNSPCESDSVFESEFVSVSDTESVSVFDYVSESVSDIERGDSKESAPSKKRFIKPTLDEVTEYVSEKRYTFNPVAFFNFYESNGWKVGKNQMKDWHAACVTWESREKNKSGAIGSDEHIQNYEWDNSLLEGVNK